MIVELCIIIVGTLRRLFASYLTQISRISQNIFLDIKLIREFCGICVSPSWGNEAAGDLLLIRVSGFEDAVPANALQQWLIGVERDNHKHWSADDVVFWHEAPVARVA